MGLVASNHPLAENKATEKKTKNKGIIWFGGELLNFLIDNHMSMDYSGCGNRR